MDIEKIEKLKNVLMKMLNKSVIARNSVCINKEDFRLVLMKMGFERKETDEVIDKLLSKTDIIFTTMVVVDLENHINEEQNNDNN